MPEDPGKRPTLTLFQGLCSGSDDERYGLLEKLEKLTPELDYPTLRQLLLDALEKDYAPTERERTGRGEVDRDQRAISRRFLVGALAHISNDDPAASTAVRLSDQERVFAQLEEMAASGTPENRQTARGLLRALAGPRELSTSAQPRLLRAFQDDHPGYDRNVFVIMSFDPQLRETWSAIQVNLDASGYTALRADMKTKSAIGQWLTDIR